MISKLLSGEAGFNFDCLIPKSILFQQTIIAKQGGGSRKEQGREGNASYIIAKNRLIIFKRKQSQSCLCSRDNQDPKILPQREQSVICCWQPLTPKPDNPYHLPAFLHTPQKWRHPIHTPLLPPYWTSTSASLSNIQLLFSTASQPPVTFLCCHSDTHKDTKSSSYLTPLLFPIPLLNSGLLLILFPTVEFSFSSPNFPSLTGTRWPNLLLLWEKFKTLWLTLYLFILFNLPVSEKWPPFS